MTYKCRQLGNICQCKLSIFECANVNDGRERGFAVSQRQLPESFQPAGRQLYNERNRLRVQHVETVKTCILDWLLEHSICSWVNKLTTVEPFDSFGLGFCCNSVLLYCKTSQHLRLLHQFDSAERKVQYERCCKHSSDTPASSDNLLAHFQTSVFARS